jgi:hypothetical protein
MSLLRTIDNPAHRSELFDRVRDLDPAQPPTWGQLTAPRMLVHLCDQMRMPFNDKPSRFPGPTRYPVFKQFILYVMPWPRGIQGPPEAFLTKPGNWPDDLGTLRVLVDEFVDTPSSQQLSDHPYLGRMSRRDWAVFCYRHFDHHFRQFGV